MQSPNLYDPYGLVADSAERPAPHLSDDRRPQPKRLLALAIFGSLAIHAFFLLLHFKETHSGGSAPHRLTVALSTPSAKRSIEPPRPPSKPPAQQRTRSHSAPAKPSHRIIAVPNAGSSFSVPVAPSQPTAAPAAPAEPPNPNDDFMAHLNARREQREEAEAQEHQLAQLGTETDDQKANRIARANVGAAVRAAQSGDEDGVGGVFELKDLHAHDASYVFRGWHQDFRRILPRIIEVQQGSAPDIQTAIVDNMIQLIREYEKNYFQWHSYRLGRTLTLSARVQDTEELRRFLKEEFFGDRRPGSR